MLGALSDYGQSFLSSHLGGDSPASLAGFEQDGSLQGRLELAGLPPICEESEEEPLAAVSFDHPEQIWQQILVASWRAFRYLRRERQRGRLYLLQDGATPAAPPIVRTYVLDEVLRTGALGLITPGKWRKWLQLYPAFGRHGRWGINMGIRDHKRVAVTLDLDYPALTRELIDQTGGYFQAAARSSAPT